MGNETTLAVTKGNDSIKIELGSATDYIVPTSKGKDSLNFSFLENMSGGKFEYRQIEDSKDLLISYTKGNITDTITIKNYFKTEDGNSTASSVKTVTIDDKTYNLTDLYQYSGEFVPNKKRSVSGTVFSDIIDESKYRNDKKQGLTIKSGDGNDVITGSRFNDTIVGGKGNNEVILKDSFGDDKIVTTKGETLNIKFNGNANQLEYVLDGKNVKAVANFPDTSCYLEGLVGISVKPMALSDGTYCTINSTVNGRTITIYNADQIGSNGKLIENASGETFNYPNPYTRYTVVEENGEYKWKSENILAGVPGNKELYLYTEPTLSLLYEDKLDDMWMPDDSSYMLLNSNIYRLEGDVKTNISSNVVTELKNGSYDITSFLFKEGLHGSVSISNMAAKDLNADVLVNGTNLEEYLSTEGHLNVTGSGKLTGTRFNDKFTGSEYNDIITGKGGHNLYEIDTTRDFGDDTIVLTNGETMTLDYNQYKTDDLKYELVNGGKDIKISSNIGATPKETSFEVRGLVHPLYVSTSEGDVITDDVSDPIEVAFKIVEENGEYKWLSANILETIAPDADPITFVLPLGAKNGEFKDYLYETEDMTADDYVMVTVDEIHAYKIVNGERTEISDSVISQIENGTYNTESYCDISLSHFDGTVTIKDFGQKDLGAILNIGNTDLAEYLSTNGVVQVSGGKGKITATRFNDSITGSISADKIYAYSGNDTINARKGNDKIYLGEGEKTLSFTTGDGNDIIYSADQAEQVNLKISEADNYEYSRKGDNLVITRTDNDGKTVNNKAVKKLYITADGDLSTSAKGNTKVGKTLYSYIEGGVTKYSTTTVEGGTDVSGKQFFLQNGEIVLAGTHKESLSETITIDGYFKNISNIIVNDEKLLQDGLLNGQVLKYGSTSDYKKAQTFKGTELYEEFIGGKGNDKIYTGSGNDTVTAGRGNDTIYLNGEGEKTINFVKGDGNDTIYMNYDGVKANLIFGDVNLIYGRKDNDLYIIRDYGSEKTEQITTVKNYFNNNTNSELSINGTKFNPKDVVFEYIGSGNIQLRDGNSYEVITGKKSDEIILSGGELYSVDSGAGNDMITITGNGDNYVNSGSGDDIVVIKGSGNNTLEYTSGSDCYMVGTGNDTYNVEFGRKTDLIISDNGGNDELNINTSLNDFTYLFDVDKNGHILADDTSLMIYDSNSLKFTSKGMSGGCIEIIDYFKESGNIETININDTTVNIDTDAISSAVGTWLADNNYDTAMQVMNEGSKEDIASLLAVYQTNA